MKLFYIILSIQLLVFSPTTFATSFEEIEAYLDKMLTYQLDFDNQGDELTKVMRGIENGLKNDNENAYLWYLKGRSSFSALYVFGKKDERYSNFRKLIPIEYGKSLKLNKENSALNADQLSRIFNKALVTDIAIEATRQYIALKQSKTTLTEKEHLTLLWERVVFGLIRQNKFDEAYEEMAKMELNFPSEKLAYANGKSWRVKLDEKVEKQKAKLAAVKALEEKSSKEEAKPELIPKVEPLDEPTAVKQDITASVLSPAESTPPTTDSNLMWYALLAGVLVIVVVVAMRRKTI